MKRGQIEHIWENELQDGRMYLSLTIDGEKYSHLSKSHKREAINVLSFIEEDETKLKQMK